MADKVYYTHLRCVDCGEEYQRESVRYLCPKCSANYRAGIPLLGVLEVLYDYEAIAQELADQGSDADLLRLLAPVEEEYYPPLPIGNTPFFQSQRLAERLAIPGLYIKFDGMSLSGSYKDRASHLMTAEAKRLGIKEIVCASTGNAACSLAAITAAAGIKATIFAPAKAPVAKLTQIRIHGADLHNVEGTYDDAFKAALSYSQSEQVLNRNTGYHPFTIEGKKTAGIEIFAELGRKVPDWIVVPTGDGVILCGIHKAFLDLQRLGLIERLPRLLSVQNETSDAVTSYWERGYYEDAAAPDTIADSISVKTPSNAHWAVKALHECGGKSIRVSDAEIRLAQSELASQAGVFAEPSSSSTLAGLKKALAKKWINHDQTIVLLVTGHGLKDINAVQL